MNSPDRSVPFCTPQIFTGGTLRLTQTWCAIAMESGLLTIDLGTPLPGGLIPTSLTTTSAPTWAAPTISTTPDPSTPVGTISGIAIGGFVAAAVVVLLALFLWKKHTPVPVADVPMQQPPYNWGAGAPIPQGYQPDQPVFGPHYSQPSAVELPGRAK